MNRQADTLFVLDTNVLIHDPNALYNFEEHQVLLPMVVLEELDKLKVGNTSLAADARQAVRTLAAIIGDASSSELQRGIEIHRQAEPGCRGRLRILMPEPARTDAHFNLELNINDNRIINDLLQLQQRQSTTKVVLVTKDINMRLKAKACGLDAEDYHSDQLVSDIQRLSAGHGHVPGSFWTALDAIEPQSPNGDSIHWVGLAAMEQLMGTHLYPNQFLYDDCEFVTRIQSVENDRVALELLNTGILMRQRAWGLAPRDLFQAMAMYLMLDPDIDLVAINGAAGSGKTILALACALELTVEQKQFKRIIATRSTRGLDEDIGFLPGTETDKMTPWLGAFTDNLEALHAEDFDPNSSEHYVGANMPLHFKSLNFVRGRSFQQTFLIIDEAQNLTPHQIKTLITRAGQGTKVLCLGNLSQIDTPYLGATSSGLTYMSERFKGFAHGGSITLKGVARSRLAAFAEEHL